MRSRSAIAAAVTGILAAGLALVALASAAEAGPVVAAVTISTGANESCATQNAGTVQCWGKNAEGGLGSGTRGTSSSLAQNVAGLTGATSVSVGTDFACALLGSGQASCWGRNTSGELGRGGTISSTYNGTQITAANVVGITGATALDAGPSHTCAVVAGGAVQCWGAGGSGRLGNASTTNRSSPVSVQGLTAAATSVSAGGASTCARLVDATVMCWGSNAFGQLGDGTTTTSTVAVAVAGLSNVESVSVGDDHACALLDDSTLRCWGNNSSGQLGIGSLTPSTSPTPVVAAGPPLTGDLRGVRAVSAGSAVTCTTMRSGQVWCWGSNALGATGSATTSGSQLTPNGVGGLAHITDASMGAKTGCALRAEGYATCWGDTASGKAGSGPAKNPGVSFNQGPVIFAEPQDLTVPGGTPATMTVEAASSSTLSYQWQRQRTTDGGWDDLLEETTSSYTVTYPSQADNTARFRVVISNPLGTATSREVSLGVSSEAPDSAPVITRSPTSRTVLTGTVVTFASAASSFPVADVQWERSDGGGPYGPIAGATGASYTLTTAESDDGSSFRARYTNALGEVATTAASLTVRTVPTVTTQPTTAVVTVGQSATFTAGAHAQPVASIQWQTSMDGGGSWVAVPGATSGSLTVAAVEATDDGTLYRAVFTNAAGSATSGAAALDVKQVDGQDPPAFSSTPAVRSSGTHTCTLTSTGRAVCWGNNSEGALGDGTRATTTSTRTVLGLTGAVQIGTGTNFSCALKATGEVRCWGVNTLGQLGNGTTTTAATRTDAQLSPQPVPGLLASGLTVGPNHACAIGLGGAVSCWGSNASGQLGDGTTTSSPSPVTVSGLTGAVAVAAGANGTCAVLAGGSVRCWGANGSGQLGDGTTSNSAVPVAVSGLSSATAVTVGSNHACALLADTSVRCWGANNAGQLGTGSTTPSSALVPVQPRNIAGSTDGLTGVRSISAGTQVTCAVTTVGKARCWGANANGATAAASVLGNSTSPIESSTPYMASAGLGAQTSCFVRATGSVFCWGLNDQGQRGTTATSGTVGPSFSHPAMVFVQPQWPTVVAGETASFTIDASGSPAPTVQWQRSNDGAPFVDIPGATAATYTTSALERGDDGAQFRAVATNAMGSDTSYPALLRVQSSPMIVTSPSDQTVVGGTTASFTSSALANPSASVQWERSNDAGTTWEPIAGATSAGYSFVAAGVDDGSRFRAVYTNSFGAIATGSANLTVRVAPVVVTDPIDVTVTVGDDATFSAAASGVPAPAAQWQVSVDGTTWSNLYGATSPTLTVPAVRASQDGVRYRVLFSSVSGSATTAAANLHVRAVGGGPVPAFRTKPKISAQDGAGCVLQPSGIVSCWGPELGLGAGRVGARTTPSTVAGLTGIVDVRSNCAIDDQHVLWCWGMSGKVAALSGTTDPEAQYYPYRVLGMGPVTRLVGDRCVEAVDGGLWCQSSTTAPFVQETDLPEGAVFDKGYSPGCVLMADGSVRCKGTNDKGQVGDGTTTDRASYVPVLGLTDAVGLTGDSGSARCALRASGQVVCWGDNGWGAVGDGSPIYLDPVYGFPLWLNHFAVAPVDAIGVSPATEVDGNVRRMCASMAGGDVMCWGNGQQNTTNGDLSQSVPSTMTGFGAIFDLSASEYSTCAITRSGSVRCSGVVGGDGNNVTYTTPHTLMTLSMPDLDAPTASATVSASASPTFNVYGGPVAVQISAADPSGVASVTWSATGAGASGPTTILGGSAAVPVSAAGTTTITYQATDAFGNTSPPQATTVRIDPRPVVSIAGESSALEPDTGSQRAVYFQFNLSRPAATDVTVSYYTRDGTATGCTNLQCDYNRFGTPANPRVETIKAGATQLTVSVPINSDAVIEPNEQFDVVVTAVGPAAVLSEQSVATATIVDADGLSQGGKPVLLLTPRTEVVEGDTGTQKGQVIVSLSKPLAKPITVYYSTGDLTARATTDYRAVSPSANASVTIPAGVLSATIDIAVVSNTLVDGDRDLAVDHRPVVLPDGVELIDVAAAARLGILDDDTLIAP